MVPNFNVFLKLLVENGYFWDLPTEILIQKVYRGGEAKKLHFP